MKCDMDMARFNEEEIQYLQSQGLARIATVDADGQPDVVPVGYEFDGTDFYVGGLDPMTSRKYRNIVAGNDRVALVIDDVLSTDPFVPRFVRVYGTGIPVQRDGRLGPGVYIRITPTVYWSWNLDGRSRASLEQFALHRITHRAA
jgi:pyridoxamine 5'-phosphate oxidase family protein